jgi:hypothetical protein
MEGDRTETETQIYGRRANRDRNPVFRAGDRTETETQYFVEGAHLHKESEQRKKPNVYERRVNRDRNQAFTQGE